MAARISKAKSTVAAAKQMKKKLRDSVDEKLKGLENQVIIDIVEGGYASRSWIMRAARCSPSGSAQPTDKAIKILSLVAENIKDSPNKIAIEGHTDSLPFRTDQITNWELSTSRASAARRELKKAALNPRALLASLVMPIRNCISRIIPRMRGIAESVSSC